MTRKYWLNFVPALLVGLGIIVATVAAKRTAGFGWWVMIGPVLLALFVVCADLFEAWLRSEHSGPSLDALIMAGAVLAAAFIVALRDPDSVASLISQIGAVCCVLVVSRAGSNRRICSCL